MVNYYFSVFCSSDPECCNGDDIIIIVYFSIDFGDAVTKTKLIAAQTHTMHKLLVTLIRCCVRFCRDIPSLLELYMFFFQRNKRKIKKQAAVNATMTLHKLCTHYWSKISRIFQRGGGEPGGLGTEFPEWGPGQRPDIGRLEDFCPPAEVKCLNLVIPIVNIKNVAMGVYWFDGRWE